MNPIKHCLCLLALGLAVVNLHAQEFDAETVSLDTTRMNAYLAAQAEILRAEAAARIDSKYKLDAERDKLHKEFMFMIGLDPLPPRSDLHLTHVRTIQRQGYEIDVLYYQSLPGFYVTANLYRPATGKGPFPALVWGPGHSADEFGAKALRQNYAIPWVRAGYVCLVIDPIQVAEVFGVHRGTHTWGKWDWFSRGYTPIGIEVWNAMRGLDYLLSRPDVDPHKITINGVSGGGHLSWMTGAADPRFNVVQPVAATCDILAHVALNLQRMACDCAYFINLYRHDWPTLAALICPRPLLMQDSYDDGYYPPDGYKRVLGRVKQIYAMEGVPDRTGLFEVAGPHGYTQAQREKAVEWSNRWLLDKTGEIHETPFEEVPHEQLGALGGMFAPKPVNINDRIDELLIPEAEMKDFDNRDEWLAERGRIMDKLRTIVFRNMPAEHHAPVVRRGEHGSVALETEPGLEIGMISYVPKSESGKLGAALYVANEGDTEEEGMWDFMKAYPFPGYAASRHQVFPRGLGRGKWDARYQKRYKRLSMLLGRSLAEMRIHDILCAVDNVCSQSSFDGEHLTLVGRGDGAVLAVYAALFDKRVTRVIVANPPRSHEHGPVLLDVLRYTDIPQVMAMLAPDVELVFLTEPDEAFDYTKRIYNLMGAEKKFRRMRTVAEALNLPARE